MTQTGRPAAATDLPQGTPNAAGGNHGRLPFGARREGGDRPGEDQARGENLEGRRSEGRRVSVRREPPRSQDKARPRRRRLVPDQQSNSALSLSVNGCGPRPQHHPAPHHSTPLTIKPPHIPWLQLCTLVYEIVAE